MERKAYARRSRAKEARLLALKLLLEDAIRTAPASDPAAVAAAAGHGGRTTS